MATAALSHKRRRLLIWLAALLLASVTALLVPLSPVSRVLAGWNSGVALFLSLGAVVMGRTDLDALRRKAIEFDGGRIAVLVGTVAAAAACIFAIVFELAGGALAGRNAGWLATLAILTILLSWCFVHFIFALHYAHEYYAPDAGGASHALAFPGDEPPLYGDFIYFSFVVGCAAQTADVSVTSRALRRVVTAHCIIAFLFNSAIIALLINIGASLLSSH